MKNRDSTATTPSPLGRMAGRTPANEEELRAMRAAAWHKLGIVVIPMNEVFDARDRASLADMAARLYGPRKENRA